MPRERTFRFRNISFQYELSICKQRGDVPHLRIMPGTVNVIVKRSQKIKSHASWAITNILGIGCEFEVEKHLPEINYSL